LSVPTFLSAKLALPPPVSVTTSPPSAAMLGVPVSVAAVVPS
jgi:hypothetical protein